MTWEYVSQKNSNRSILHLQKYHLFLSEERSVIFQFSFINTGCLVWKSPWIATLILSNNVVFNLMLFVFGSKDLSCIKMIEVIHRNNRNVVSPVGALFSWHVFWFLPLFPVCFCLKHCSCSQSLAKNGHMTPLESKEAGTDRQPTTLLSRRGGTPFVAS